MSTTDAIGLNVPQMKTEESRMSKQNKWKKVKKKTKSHTTIFDKEKKKSRVQ